jgi:hypothetical protein
MRRASGEAKTRAPSPACGAAGRAFGGAAGAGARPRRGRRSRLAGLAALGAGAADVLGAFAFLQQHGDGGVDLHALGALGDQDLADGALVHGLEFHRGLVGLDLGDEVARRLTVSPSLTSHFASVPSSIVGESAGIRISVGIASPPQR